MLILFYLFLFSLVVFVNSICLVQRFLEICHLLRKYFHNYFKVITHLIHRETKSHSLIIMTGMQFKMIFKDDTSYYTGIISRFMIIRETQVFARAF